jgi:uncharacterized protein (TIGR03437 family)
MNCDARRAAHPRCFLTFAILLSALANLAYATSPDISFSPSSLNFKYQLGSALPASQSLQIKSTGAVLAFTISITGPLPYSAQWLSVSANSGSTSATLKVYVNPTGLPAGSYSGTIVVNAPSAATPIQNFPVTLDVGDAPATLTTSTAALAFNFTTGNAIPASQSIVLMSTGGALTAAISITGGAWLKASPNGSIALVGLPATITVSVDPTGLTPASYTGKITFASSTAANKSTSVNITLNVTAGVPTVTANGVWPAGALVNSPATIVTLTGTNYFPTSTAAIGVTSLTTTVLSSTTMLVTIPANLMTTAGTLAIVVTTPTAASPSAPASFTVYGPGPQIWAVAQSASYTTSTVSPGGIITVYGVNLGPASLSTFPGTDPIPTSLPAAAPSTSITIDGVAAPLLYTSSSQVSCIVPFSLSAKSGSSVNLILTYNSLASPAFPVNVVDADPGIFTVDASGTGQGAILNYNAVTRDYTVNSAANAATKGSTVSIYITGYGVTSCADTAASTCVPNASEVNLIAGSVTPVATVTVTIDGQAAAVQGAASPIGSVPGVLQINATVPTTVKPGNSVPVFVSVGAARSQSRVTMCVK